jgi:AcrR family transcriptional regulator
MARNGISSGGPPRERSEEVYAAALRLFTEKGYHATSMQDIAAAVGLYKGSLYHYIGSKEDLLLEVFERAMGSLLTDVEKVVADNSICPSEQLRQLVHAHVTAVAANREALTVYLHDFRALAGEAFERVREQRERYRALVEHVIRRGVDSGELHAKDVGIATLAVLGMCNWLVQWYRPGGRLRPAQIADRFTDLVLSGLYFEPSTRSPTASPKLCISDDE